jgi:hypothetical protein
MRKETGLGMGAFFAQAGREPQALPEPGQPSPTVRTTITLTQEDAERLEVLRMHLRRREGRGLTYSDVVGLALRRLAESEPLPQPFPPTQT